MARAIADELPKTDDPNLVDAAWNATTALINYSAFINHSPPAGLAYAPASKLEWTGFAPQNEGYFFRLQSQAVGIVRLPFSADSRMAFSNPPSVMPKVYLFGTAGEEQAAMIGSEANLNPNEVREKRTIFPAYIGVTAAPGTSILVGGIRLRNVIFLNSSITYDGSLPITLENVSFVNCEFKIKRDAETAKFAAALMVPGPTNIKG